MTMRRKANLSVILLAILFVVMVWCNYRFAHTWWITFLLYTTEAGLIGALADWFAITVLFRHPFGLKSFPHTAIIPRNRDKLVDGIVVLVEKQLLSKDLLYSKLENINFVKLLLQLGDQPAMRQQWGNKLWDWMLQLATAERLGSLAKWTNTTAQNKLKAMEPAPLLGKALHYALEQGTIDRIIRLIIPVLAKKLEEPEIRLEIYQMLEREKQKISEQGSGLKRWFKQQLIRFAEETDAVNLQVAATVLHRDAVQFVHRLQDDEHEVRQLLDRMLQQLSVELQSSTDLEQTIRQWMEQLLEKLSFEPIVLAMLTDIKEAMGANNIAMRRWLQHWITIGWRHFRSNQSLQQQLQQYIKQLLVTIIESEHAQIGQIVRSTLDEFTEDKLVHFIESKVEVDLQRIRLNGALIGSAAGALIYIFLHTVYAPLLGML